MDLSSLLSEIKHIPDDRLRQELDSPTGLVPGWMVLGEMAERAEIRGGGRPPATTVADRYRSQPKGYAEGGLVEAMNPFVSLTEVMQNPENAAKMAELQLAKQHANQPTPIEPRSLQAPPPAPGLEGLVPMAGGRPLTPDAVGLPALIRGRM